MPQTQGQGQIISELNIQNLTGLGADGFSTWKNNLTGNNPAIANSDIVLLAPTAFEEVFSGYEKRGTITVSTGSWTNNQDGSFSKTVTFSGTITNNTKIDLQPNTTLIKTLIDDGICSLQVVNNNQTLTLYVISDVAPTWTVSTAGSIGATAKETR